MQERTSRPHLPKTSAVKGFCICRVKEMKDDDVNRGSVHVSADALYVSPYFLFYFSAFLISLRIFY